MSPPSAAGLSFTARTLISIVSIDDDPSLSVASYSIIAFPLKFIAGENVISLSSSSVIPPVSTLLPPVKSWPCSSLGILLIAKVRACSSSFPI